MLMTTELTEIEYYSVTRKLKNIKLKDIATVLRCSVPLLSMYERGKTTMNEDFIRKYREIIDNK